MHENKQRKDKKISSITEEHPLAIIAPGFLSPLFDDLRFNV
jgi:hypothetical protein